MYLNVHNTLPLYKYKLRDLIMQNEEESLAICL